LHCNAARDSKPRPHKPEFRQMPLVGKDLAMPWLIAVSSMSHVSISTYPSLTICDVARLFRKLADTASKMYQIVMMLAWAGAQLVWRERRNATSA